MSNAAALLRGLFEAHLHVSDLERAKKFYGDVLGLELGFEDTERRAAFYWIEPAHTSMLGMWEMPPWLTPSDAEHVRPQHVAFEVAFHDLTSLIAQAKQCAVEFTNFFGLVTDEPSVFGWIPAASIYFYDPDRNLLEFIAKLDDEPSDAVGVVSLHEWQRLQQHAARK
jgi:lactoylglutathione lyase